MIMEEQEEYKNLLDTFILPLTFVAVLWFIHLFGLVLSMDLGGLGVFPRASKGILGILTAPLIHADFSHLLSNTFPFLVTSCIIMYFYRRVAVQAMLLIYFFTGLMVWILAREVYHIGASGVVYGLVSFIFWSGIFVKDRRSIVLALIVTFLYSGMFMGILPDQPGISWESHLFGAIVGIVIAYGFRKELKMPTVEDPWEVFEADTKSRYFLPRDVFEQTKAERAKEQWAQNFWNTSTTWEDDGQR